MIPVSGITLVNGVNRFGFLGNHDFLVCQNELACVGVGIILSEWVRRVKKDVPISGIQRETVHTLSVVSTS